MSHRQEIYWDMAAFQNTSPADAHKHLGKLGKRLHRAADVVSTEADKDVPTEEAASGEQRMTVLR